MPMQRVEVVLSILMIMFESEFARKIRIPTSVRVIERL
jgi:hypothetical protein